MPYLLDQLWWFHYHWHKKYLYVNQDESVKTCNHYILYNGNITIQKAPSNGNTNNEYNKDEIFIAK